MFTGITGAFDIRELDTKRMTLEGYVQGFGATADLVPAIFERQDFELIFDTIVNERIDATIDDF